MPMYEFRCRDCGQKFERLLSPSYRTEDVRCPQCGEAAAEKQFSSFASTSSGARGSAASSRSCGTSFG